MFGGSEIVDDMIKAVVTKKAYMSPSERNGRSLPENGFLELAVSFNYSLGTKMGGSD